MNKALKNKIKDILIKIAKGEITSSFYDLDSILSYIAKLSDDNTKYDILTRRFFEGEMGTLTVSDGWFCHIIIWRYNEEKDEYYKDMENSIKVFGCDSPKEAVIKALKILLKDEMEKE